MKAKSLLALLLLALLPAALHAGTPPGKTQNLTTPDQVPDGLAKSDWQSICAAYEAGRHALQPIEPPWQAIKEWNSDDEPDLDWFNRSRNSSNPDRNGFDQSPTWQAHEVQWDDDRILVL